MIGVFLLLVACAPDRVEPPAPAPAPEVPTATPQRTPELDTHLHALITPRHPSPYAERSHRDAVAWFLAHPDEAEPALIAWYDEMPPARERTVRVLGRLGREDSLPVLERALHDTMSGVSYQGGQALAVHPDPQALRLLVDALRSDDAETWGSAMRGLQTRGDAGACDAVVPFVDDADPTRRYYALRTAFTVGCIDAARVEAVRQSDPAEDVRTLAGKLLEGE